MSYKRYEELMWFQSWLLAVVRYNFATIHQSPISMSIRFEIWFAVESRQCRDFFMGILSHAENFRFQRSETSDKWQN